MSSEQVERLETYFVFIDGDEDEPEQVYLKSDADDVIRGYRQENKRLKNGLLYLRHRAQTIQNGEAPELGFVGFVVNTVGAALEEQETQDE